MHLHRVAQLGAERPGRDEAGEVAHEVVGSLHDQLPMIELIGCVHDDICVTQVLEVVGPPLGTQHQVPIRPSHRPEPEVLKYIESKGLSPRPPLRYIRLLVHHAPAVARLGGQNKLLRRQQVSQFQVLRIEPPVPMHAHAREVTAGRVVSVELSGPFEHVVFVVVKSDDFDVRMLFFERGPQIVPHKGRHKGGGVQASFPPHRRLGLVLHSHAPHGDAVGGVCRDESGKVTGPRVLHVRVKAVRAG
mmetsp:Transcript_7731/g.25349  ORF Transcript_7731/g.25349 Transcript_7731/m.25349 type:complete len:246 (+) Transcript_7731:2171-2908(+)